MQKVILFIIIIFFTTTIKAQNSGLPNVVNKAFEQKFPKAKKVKWSNENIDDYMAEFALDSVTETAVFTSKGEWQQTAVNVPVLILNRVITLSLKKKYPKQKVNKIARIENIKKQLYYEIELKKGDELKYVYYDESGEEIASVK